MYKMIELNYNYGDLEPYIDAKTVEIHYSKHHQNYLNKTNALLESNGYTGNLDITELYNNLNLIKESDHEAFLFNLGGVVNHNLYWTILSPNKNVSPVGKVASAIDLEFGSYDLLKEKMIAMANSVMGSGWVFLVVNKDNKLELVKTKNQDSPYMMGLKPIIALDLWEHSYYLSYQNLRPDYINNFFNLIDFEVVNKLYEEII
jgi:superoxide dismutase, Fe-Mn family